MTSVSLKTEIEKRLVAETSKLLDSPADEIKGIDAKTRLDLGNRSVDENNPDRENITLFEDVGAGVLEPDGLLE
jgi:hypothetical protein